MLPTSPRLRRIVAAYTINKLGTWFGTVALSLAIYDHTHSAAAVTALFVARYLPALAVPALVARVEASTRRRTLSALYAFEALCAALLAALVWHFLLPAILVLVALDGAVELTASSLLRAQAARAGAEESSEQGIYNANAALNVALSASVVIGPTLGALAVRAFGAPVALLIDAGSFLACGALVVNLYVHVEERAGASVRARLASAWEHVREAPALRAVLLTQATALVFFETGAPVEVFYAKGTLRAGDVGYGVLLAVWGVGQLGGSLLFARGARRSLGAMLTLGTLAVGLAYLGFAAAPTLATAALAALLGGVGNGVQWASLLGTVQTAHARAPARAADGRRGIDRRPLPPDRAAPERAGDGAQLAPDRVRCLRLGHRRHHAGLRAAVGRRHDPRGRPHHEHAARGGPHRRGSRVDPRAARSDDILGISRDMTDCR